MIHFLHNKLFLKHWVAADPPSLNYLSVSLEHNYCYKLLDLFFDEFIGCLTQAYNHFYVKQLIFETQGGGFTF